MGEFKSSRRQDVKATLDIPDFLEKEALRTDLRKEEVRRFKKDIKRKRLMRSPAYLFIQRVSTFWDKFFIDPILSLVIPEVGGFISSFVCLPAVWISIIRIHSVPLALAVIYNLLVDILLGLIPFGIGSILDAFHMANSKNFKLIKGFVDDDKNIIKEINSKARRTCVFIVVIIILIILMILLMVWIIKQFITLWQYIVGLF